MSVICVASLKGGVGKTSVSLNLGHSFAQRGCQTLLIDLDPAAHASRYLNGRNSKKASFVSESALARLFLSNGLSTDREDEETLFDAASDAGILLNSPFRENLDIIRGGPEIRHFYWGRGSRQFCNHFPNFIEECKDTYDYIILDTAPDLNVVSRNAIAASDLVLVPVDSSVMSIYSLEEIVSACSHIKGPVWSIVRTMVNKRASRVQRLISERLDGNSSILAGGCEAPGLRDEDEGCTEDFDLESVEGFRAALKEYESEDTAPDAPLPSVPEQVDNPIYLLNSIIYRTENQNRLSFLNCTSLDREETKALAEQYLSLAREVEEMLALTAEQIGDFQDTGMPDLMCSRFG